MAQFKVKIDNHILNKFSETLTQLHKSAMPIAIRGTINDAAYFMKTDTLLKTSEASFTIRQKNFFKANSKFEPAKGFDVRRMVATVGMYDDKLRRLSGGKNYAVSELEQQEEGGSITHKTFIGMRAARIGGKGLIRAAMRYSDIKDKIISSKRGSLKSVAGRKRKQQLIRAAFVAKKMNGENAFVMGNKNSKGSRTIFQVKMISTLRLHKDLKNGKLDLKLIPIYTVKDGRVISVKRTNYMKRAALGTSVVIDDFFFKQAHRQLVKYTAKYT